MIGTSVTHEESCTPKLMPKNVEVPRPTAHPQDLCTEKQFVRAGEQHGNNTVAGVHYEYIRLLYNSE